VVNTPLGTGEFVAKFLTTPDLQGFGVVALFIIAQEALTWHVKPDGNWPSFSHRFATAG
jgi:hypothetical protein